MNKERAIKTILKSIRKVMLEYDSVHDAIYYADASAFARGDESGVYFLPYTNGEVIGVAVMHEYVFDSNDPYSADQEVFEFPAHIRALEKEFAAKKNKKKPA